MVSLVQAAVLSGAKTSSINISELLQYMPFDPIPGDSLMLTPKLRGQCIMEINEVRVLKNELVDDIKSLISIFEEKTDVAVAGIYYHRELIALPEKYKHQLELLVTV